MTRRAGDDPTTNGSDDHGASGLGRRRFLRTSAVVAGGALVAGCSSGGTNASANGSNASSNASGGTNGTVGNASGNASTNGSVGIKSFRGSGPLVESRPR